MSVRPDKAWLQVYGVTSRPPITKSFDFRLRICTLRPWGHELLLVAGEKGKIGDVDQLKGRTTGKFLRVTEMAR